MFWVAKIDNFFPLTQKNLKIFSPNPLGSETSKRSSGGGLEGENAVRWEENAFFSIFLGLTSEVQKSKVFLTKWNYLDFLANFDENTM